MSSTIIIKAAALTLRHGNDVVLLPCVRVYTAVEPVIEHSGEYAVDNGKLNFINQWQLILGSRAVDIYPECKLTADRQSYVKTFCYTGFHDTCKEIIRVLELNPSDYEIV